MGDWVRRHQLAAFYVLAVGISSLVVAVRVAVGSADMLPVLWAFLERHSLYANTVSIAWFSLEDWRALLIFGFAGAPTLAALTVVGLSDGPAGLKELFRRLRPWLDVSPRQGRAVYLWLLVVYLVGLLTYRLLASWSNGTPTPSTLGGSWKTALVWLAIGPFVDEGGLWEELGWRGFALPLLLDRMRSPLRASLLLGFLWWAWHFPREIPTLLTGTQLGSWAFWQGVFLLLCIALSILITWAFIQTGGSVWPALLIHGLTNVWSKALGASVNELVGGDLRTWIVLAAAALAVAVTRGRLGLQSPMDGSGSPGSRGGADR